MFSKKNLLRYNRLHSDKKSDCQFLALSYHSAPLLNLSTILFHPVIIYFNICHIDYLSDSYITYSCDTCLPNVLVINVPNNNLLLSNLILQNVLGFDSQKVVDFLTWLAAICRNFGTEYLHMFGLLYFIFPLIISNENIFPHIVNVLNVLHVLKYYESPKFLIWHKKVSNSLSPFAPPFFPVQYLSSLSPLAVPFYPRNVYSNFALSSRSSQTSQIVTIPNFFYKPVPSGTRFTSPGNTNIACLSHSLNSSSNANPSSRLSTFSGVKRRPKPSPIKTSRTSTVTVLRALGTKYLSWKYFSTLVNSNPRSYVSLSLG